MFNGLPRVEGHDGQRGRGRPEGGLAWWLRREPQMLDKTKQSRWVSRAFGGAANASCLQFGRPALGAREKPLQNPRKLK